jgi:PPOX class probable F420-dependent enzyme
MKAQVRSLLEAKEIELVEKPVMGKIATVGSDGSPHVTPVWFMYENGRFVITTAEKTVKVQNIRRDNRINLLIDDAYKYVLVKGKAKVNDERNVEKDTERLAVRYLGEEAGRKMLPDILKVKHVVLEVIPEEISSFNL